ncbi:hypothetical protein A4H97_03190 [Niastella yeongjuensis]|uniref:Macroglobulin domain-containing protein n=1 Tax=Niastella yeongjuensis TaxID=354355 RepID=A0A1V9EY15_9BACT|nr:hypothetical protein [Niastella yeongjuensis]OQP50845.1 hypothetical protein A4H97_03190 [Niastella yeongjuensis]SEN15049.1 hypothetical protein SAMN05660816_00303 [Niastella yeongjuensis]
MKPFNHKILISLLLLIVLLLFKKLTYAQGPLAVVPAQYKQYCNNMHPEKMYVHTDKNFYLAGELLWFKIYNVDGALYQPADLSKIAYVEILDKDNKPVMQTKIPLTKGKGNGSFFLPVSVNSGNYKLRAYTNWMKNFSAAFYFEKPVTIVNTQKALTSSPVDTITHYQVVFLPEGGNLVNGITTKVAFKVTDRFGKGMDCKGWVLSQHNDTLLSFQSFRFGMGHFMFTPNSAQPAKAVISLANGRTIIQNLPAAYEQGYVMQLSEETAGSIKVNITSKPASSQPVYLFVHSHQVMQVTEKQTITNGVATFLIDKNKLAEGVSTFTVFNDRQQPVCERLYFKKPQQILSVAANSNSVQYGNRKRVALSVNTQHANVPAGSPANLSVAVYRIDTLQTIDPNSVLSYLWLTSELAGNIESPAYYFSTDNDELKEATDNLLLVHGWRKFDWDSILTDKRPVFEYVPEFDGHIISCQVKNNDHTVAAGSTTDAWLSIPGIPLQFYNSRASDKGKIFFDVRDYYGQNEIIIQTDNTDSNAHVDVMNPFSEKYSDALLPPFSLPVVAQNSLNEQSVGMQVLNTYKADKLSQFAVPVIDTTPFYGKPTNVYKLDDYVRFTTMEEVLREYVPEVAIRRYGGQLHLKVFDYDAHDFYPNDPLILLDGVKVDNNILLGFDPLKVNKLEVVTNNYIKGEFIYPGIVNFTTYHGDMESLKLDSRAVILDYEGLQLKRNFYSPVYKTEQQASSRLPDFRNLLYWEPDVQTDATGKATVEFFTGDIKGKYVAVLQGMDDAGYAGSYYFTFDVTNK